MDVAENGLAAGADLIRISIREDREADRMEIRIADNGRGVPKERLAEIFDPFYTTRTTRRVGLGLSLFREASRRCEGDLEVQSEEGRGTEVVATFRMSHIDLPPLGDMAGTMAALIAGNREVDFIYVHEVDGRRFDLDTREIQEQLEGIPLDHPEVIRTLSQTIRAFLLKR